jgi:hypothetical protein
MALARMAACDELRMTRDQQIRKALELLAPPRLQRAECRHDIKIALNRVEQGAAAAQSFRVAGSKKGKAEVMRYCAALRRLRNAYHALDPAIRPWFSLSETAYVAGKPTVIDREIAIAEVFLARPSPPPRPDASRNKLAVAAAYDVLNWWGQRAVITRSGKWAKLAAILAGDMSVDLFDHMREFRRRPSRSIEKVRGAHAILYQTRRR